MGCGPVPGPSSRLRRLEQARAEHQRAIDVVEERLARQHAEVEAFKAAFEAGEPDAVVQYFALVLERSHYPEGFRRVTGWHKAPRGRKPESPDAEP
jgi:hypothetical protein